jgi:hypothetical protein
MATSSSCLTSSRAANARGFFFESSSSVPQVIVDFERKPAPKCGVFKGIGPFPRPGMVSYTVTMAVVPSIRRESVFAPVGNSRLTHVSS